jgi:hypothetical protein
MASAKRSRVPGPTPERAGASTRVQNIHAALTLAGVGSDKGRDHKLPWYRDFVAVERNID